MSKASSSPWWHPPCVHPMVSYLAAPLRRQLFMSKVSSDPLGSEPNDAEVDEAVLTHQSELGLSNKEAEGIKALQARAMLSVAGAMCSRLS